MAGVLYISVYDNDWLVGHVCPKVFLGYSGHALKNIGLSLKDFISIQDVFRAILVSLKFDKSL